MEELWRLSGAHKVSLSRKGKLWALGVGQNFNRHNDCPHKFPLELFCINLYESLGSSLLAVSKYKRDDWVYQLMDLLPPSRPRSLIDIIGYVFILKSFVYLHTFSNILPRFFVDSHMKTFWHSLRLADTPFLNAFGQLVLFIHSSPHTIFGKRKPSSLILKMWVAGITPHLPFRKGHVQYILSPF